MRFGLEQLDGSIITPMAETCGLNAVFVPDALGSVYSIYYYTYNAHLPDCFRPWTFPLNNGLNMLPSDPFMSYLDFQLWYSTEFQALQLILLVVFDVVD